MKHSFRYGFVFLIGWICSFSAFALMYPLSSNDDLVGELKLIGIDPNDNIYKVARRYEVGFEAMVRANPGIEIYGKLKANRMLVIPSFFILPDAPHQGIIVNLPEMRLYFYPLDQDKVVTEPIAIGRIGWGTPEVTSYVIEKVKDPIWQVPPSIKRYSALKGEMLPDVMLPGPANPLGQYALRLGIWTILLHGTNDPTSIGKRISSGCIRLYPEDIDYFYHHVQKYTPVYIINEPYKVGWYQGALYLEVHPALSETEDSPEERQQKVVDLINKKIEGKNVTVDWNIVMNAIDDARGIPYKISV